MTFAVFQLVHCLKNESRPFLDQKEVAINSRSRQHDNKRTVKQFDKSYKLLRQIDQLELPSTLKPTKDSPRHHTSGQAIFAVAFDSERAYTR